MIYACGTGPHLHDAIPSAPAERGPPCVASGILSKHEVQVGVLEYVGGGVAGDGVCAAEEDRSVMYRAGV